MTRIALGVEYDGFAYCGWQTQKGVPTVQDTLEKALSKIANEMIQVQCAGRTDTGVHGLAQVVHFDTAASRDDFSWILGTNSNLPDDISVQWAQPVSEDFHARFSAIRRTYRYHILNQRSPSAVLANKVVWEPRPLEVQSMQIAAQALIGKHDFSAYRSLACQSKSPIRTIYRLEISQQGPLITIEIEANAFLHHMVRNIAGVLMAIGMQREDTRWAAEVLATRDRRLGGITARPEGLFLIRVDYPDAFAIPNRSVIEPLLFN